MFNDLPIVAKNRESALSFGARLGKVIEIYESTPSIYGKFICIRVMVDITKQLRRGIMIYLYRREEVVDISEIRETSELLLYVWEDWSCGIGL